MEVKKVVKKVQKDDNEKFSKKEKTTLKEVKKDDTDREEAKAEVNIFKMNANES